MTLQDAIEARFGPQTGKAPHRLSGSRWDDLPALLSAMGMRRGAEIGVEQGRYSERLCQQINGLSLLCVDAWAAYTGYREHVDQDKLDGFFAATHARLAPYGCDIRRGTSATVAAEVPDRSLDFVYIDANHRLEFVVADLAAWVPKVRRGGIIAGHDYRRDDKHHRLYHVREAVHAWVSAYQIPRWYLLTGDSSPSWLWEA